MPIDLGFAGVHVLVTGASGGIGLQTVTRFLEQGALVTAQYNTNSHSLEPLTSTYGADRLRAVQANLAVELDVAQLFGRAETTFGPVIVAVINHGYAVSDELPLMDISLQQWHDTLDANLTSSFLVAREYLRRLAAQPNRGLFDKVSIVFVGSTAGKYGEAGNADYACSKSAIMYGLTRTLKNEIVKIAHRGRVNCVAPGWVLTPMAAHALENPEILYRAMATTPLKKVAMPDDIATQILVLASSQVSGHVTGQVVMVEGGMEGRLLNKPEDINIPKGL